MCSQLIIKFGIFVLIARVEARYVPSSFYWPSVCPPHAPHRSCYPNPCLVHKCPMRPDAKCEPNHCGECRADFFDEQERKINFKTCFDFSCRPNLPIESCSNLKKEKVKCEEHPDAIFIGPSGCLTCGAFFKFGRRLLARECMKNSFDEAHCQGPRKPCSEDPCKTATCNTTSSTLICVPDYCKCTHHFVNEFNQPIRCRKPILKLNEIECPTDTIRDRLVRCRTDICKRMCKSDPEAICIQECGTCQPWYFDRKGNRLSRQSCL